MNVVEIYTDGACQVTTGKGGFAAVLICKDRNLYKEVSGGYADTTNNRMELMGPIRALQLLKGRCKVTITSDSSYVVNGVMKGWARNWMSKPNFAGKKNEDLWRLLMSLVDQHEVIFNWVRGHNGHEYNERCDELAVQVYLQNEELETDGRDFYRSL